MLQLIKCRPPKRDGWGNIIRPAEFHFTDSCFGLVTFSATHDARITSSLWRQGLHIYSTYLTKKRDPIPNVAKFLKYVKNSFSRDRMYDTLSSMERYSKSKNIDFKQASILLCSIYIPKIISGKLK